MPTLLAPHASVAPDGPRRKRWTRTECEALQSMGLLDHQHRFELVEGDLIDKMGKKRPHVNSLVLLMVWLQQVFGVAFVNPEAPVDVACEDNSTSEPEPDLIVLNRGLAHFGSRNPGPRDLVLVVEVADSSLGLDLGTKARLYARAGIVEYWVLDIQGRRLVVHRNPEAGRYESISVYGENEPVAPLAAPESEFRASYAFPVSAP